MSKQKVAAVKNIDEKTPPKSSPAKLDKKATQQSQGKRTPAKDLEAERTASAIRQYLSSMQNVKVNDVSFDMFKDDAYEMDEQEAYLPGERRSLRVKRKGVQDRQSGWYKVSERFWQEQEASDVGMSLGYPHLLKQDIEFSRSMFERFKR